MSHAKLRIMPEYWGVALGVGIAIMFLTGFLAAAALTQTTADGHLAKSLAHFPKAKAVVILNSTVYLTDLSGEKGLASHLKDDMLQAQSHLLHLLPAVNYPPHIILTLLPKHPFKYPCIDTDAIPKGYFQDAIKESNDQAATRGYCIRAVTYLGINTPDMYTPPVVFAQDDSGLIHELRHILVDYNAPNAYCWTAAGPVPYADHVGHGGPCDLLQYGWEFQSRPD